MRKSFWSCVAAIGWIVFAVLPIWGQGITADPLIGALSYSQFEELAPNEIWLLIDQAEYWAIPRDPPPDYYTSVDMSSASALRSTLHALIDEHKDYDYSTTDTPEKEGFEVDTWDIIALADAHPELPYYVLDLYLNGTFQRQTKGVMFARHYDREHTWPKSLGFKSEKSLAYTDCHHLFAAYSSYNSSRGNKPYGTSSLSQGVCKPTERNLERGGPSFCNLRFAKVWEVWEGRRGDVARAMFYMAIRYEGDTQNEPDLELTDDSSHIKTSTAWETQGKAFMGLLSVLVKWHKEDPVDDLEKRRNSVIYLFQGNRNPFVDHPEWVQLL